MKINLIIIIDIKFITRKISDHNDNYCAIIKLILAVIMLIIKLNYDNL